MVISKTPYRISFFGGGTDYPSWYLENGGEVLSTTIDKYCYITCRYLPPFFEHKYNIRWSKHEKPNSRSEISHPSIRACLEYLNISEGVSISHDGDLPARSGIGSSSAFTAGMLKGLHAMSGVSLSKEKLLQETLYVEHEMLKEAVGSQDQTAAVYGGLNHIEFKTSGQIEVSPLEISSETLLELQSHLILFFTGLQRTASDVASTYVKSLDQKAHALNELRSMVYESISILQKKLPICQFGKLLDHAWKIKRGLSHSISSDHIDDLYRCIILAGATGGKITGAGGGGFLLVFAEPHKHANIRQQLNKLLHVPFKFENLGSHLLSIH